MELDIEKIKAETQQTLRRNRVVLLVLFSAGAVGLFGLIHFAPALNSQQKEVLLQFPKTPKQLFWMSQVIEKYINQDYWYFVGMFCYMYIYLQAFSIPGPPLLNILGGALFGLWLTLGMATVCGSIGTALCYILVESFGKGLTIRWFPETVLSFHKRVQNHRHNLFFYMLSLRVTPFIPKWLCTICSPIIGVPLKHTFWTSFIGLIPAHVVQIQAGLAISNLQQFGLNWQTFLMLFGLGACSLVPTLFRNKNKDD